MVNPAFLCRQHLLGEHNEIHKHRHNFVKGHRIKGRIEINAVEPMAMQARHDELVEEMIIRGYKHKSPYEQPNLDKYSDEDREAKVDKESSLKMLVDRCQMCKIRHREEKDSHRITIP